MIMTCSNRVTRFNAALRVAFLMFASAPWRTQAAPVHASEYQQKQGVATVRLEAEKVEADHVEIRLSDELQLVVSVEGGSSLEVEFPQVLATPSDWQVRRESGPEKVGLAGGKFLWRQTFGLSPLKAGELSLAVAPLRFRASPEQARWEEVTWRPISVHVSTEIYRADLSELRDIAPPEELPPPPSWGVPLTWAGAALGMLVLLLTGWIVLRRWRRSPELALSPDRWALRELQLIPLPTEPVENAVEEFYTRLSDVLRRYLELRFQVPAPEQTTTEFLAAMRRSPHLPPEQQATLRDFLERCDLVKFARAPSSAEECRTVAEMARAIVERTAANGVVISGTSPEPPTGRSADGMGCD